MNSNGRAGRYGGNVLHLYSNLGQATNYSEVFGDIPVQLCLSLSAQNPGHYPELATVVSFQFLIYSMFHFIQSYIPLQLNSAVTITRASITP
jgi:hypothetical protein